MVLWLRIIGEGNQYCKLLRCKGESQLVIFGLEEEGVWSIWWRCVGFL